MNQGLDESAAAGECPLCRSAVPVPAQPRSAGDVLAVLAQHFGTACPAIDFPPARAAPAQLEQLEGLAQRGKDMGRQRVGTAWPRNT